MLWKIQVTNNNYKKINEQTKMKNVVPLFCPSKNALVTLSFNSAGSALFLTKVSALYC